MRWTDLLYLWYAPFSLKTGYNQCDATMQFDPGFLPAPITPAADTPATRWGIFGRVHESTRETGNLQRC
jgi:hypothetical protein